MLEIKFKQLLNLDYFYYGSELTTILGSFYKIETNFFLRNERCNNFSFSTVVAKFAKIDPLPSTQC